MNHWPFIVASYAVFALFLILDAVLPQLRQRRLLKSMAQRSRRQRKRNTPLLVYVFADFLAEMIQ